MDRSNDETAAVTQIDAFLNTLRRSAEIAQEFLRASAHQGERIRSLEGDLASARIRTSFLEHELGKIRSVLGEVGPDQAQLAMLEELVEDQNCLAQLFVTSDRLARVDSLAAALDVVVEVLHNLVGAHRYGVFVRDEGGGLRLVAPTDPRYRVDDGEQRALVTAALTAGVTVKLAIGARPPLAVPLRLGGKVVGALLLVELVPQLGGQIGRLQQELLALLTERMASAMCVGAFHESNHAREEPWKLVTSTLARAGERSR